MREESGFWRYLFKEMDPGLRWLALTGFTCAGVAIVATIVGAVLTATGHH